VKARSAPPPEIVLTSPTGSAEGRTISLLRHAFPGLRRPLFSRPSRGAAAACAQISASIALTAFALVSCATPSAPSALGTTAPSSAHLDLINLSPVTWRVVFATHDGRETRVAEVPANTTTALTLAPGAYTLTQTALTGLPTATASRQLPATFVAGETYHWPLVTLLTGTDASAP
jgi:hypothetical protein